MPDLTAAGSLLRAGFRVIDRIGEVFAAALIIALPYLLGLIGLALGYY